MKTLAAYAKGIAAGLGAAATALQPIYGAEHWYVVVPAAATFFATIGIANTPKSAVTTPLVSADTIRKAAAYDALQSK